MKFLAECTKCDEKREIIIHLYDIKATEILDYMKSSNWSLDNKSEWICPSCSANPKLEKYDILLNEVKELREKFEKSQDDLEQLKSDMLVLKLQKEAQKMNRWITWRKNE